jgi:hypothetical protein
VSENVRNWTASQRKYMIWLATPDDDRMPNKHVNMAAEMGVDERTLYRWRKLPGFYAEVNKLVDENLGDAYADVANQLKRLAALGSFQHQKMYLELIGRYVQKQEITGRDGAALVPVQFIDVVRPAEQEQEQDGK